MLDLVFQNNTGEEAPLDNFFIKVFETCDSILKLGDKNIELSLNLVGEEKIKELNKQYRNKDEVTDVLSFPMNETFNFQLPALPAGRSTFNSIDLGDIFICLPFAKKQAKLENVDIETKLAQLAVHGFLHLLGYDHEKSEEEAEKMFNLEKQILSKL